MGDIKMAELVNGIATGLDRGRRSKTVFIDFKQAFDTLEHQILTDMLTYTRVGGTDSRE